MESYHLSDHDVETIAGLDEPMVNRRQTFPRYVGCLLAALLRRGLCRVGLARIMPFAYYDPASEQTISLTRSESWVVISAGGRDYYLDPLTGQLDGTGSLVLRG